MPHARALSFIVALLALAQSIAGFFVRGTYRDCAWVTLDLRGNDLVTALVAVPLLIVSATLAARGSARALRIWLGLLFYMVYNYAFYLFGGGLNVFFPLYAALIPLTLFAVIALLPAVDPKPPATAHRWVASYMLLLAPAPFAASAGAENAWSEAPMWVVVLAGCVASCVALLRTRRTGMPRSFPNREDASPARHIGRDPVGAPLCPPPRPAPGVDIPGT